MSTAPPTLDYHAGRRQLQVVAVHEAGHAMACLLMGWQLAHAKVWQGPGGWQGETLPFKERDRSPAERAVMLAAGAAAEAAWLRIHSAGDGHDFEKAAACLGISDPDVAAKRFVAIAGSVALVFSQFRTRRAGLAIARRLAESGCVDGEELLALAQWELSTAWPSAASLIRGVVSSIARS